MSGRVGRAFHQYMGDAFEQLKKATECEHQWGEPFEDSYGREGSKVYPLVRIVSAECKRCGFRLSRKTREELLRDLPVRGIRREAT